MMKSVIFLLFITSVFSCVKLEPVEEESDKIWIGKWDNNLEHFEIRENGFALWNTTDNWTGAGLFNWDTWVTGTVDISPERLVFKEQRVPAGARKKKLTITQAPTEEINSNGEPVVICVLNGKRYIKSQ